MEELAACGAHAATRKDLAENAEVIITMLPNGPQVREVILGDVIKDMRPGQIFIDCSSISPVVSKEIAAALAEEGPRYTSAGFMKIKIIGKSGHGAMPQFLVDPIYVGCKVVDGLQSLVSREVNPNDTVVVSICTFHSGSLPNIFDQTAELTGTVRTFNPGLPRNCLL